MSCKCLFIYRRKSILQHYSALLQHRKFEKLNYGIVEKIKNLNNKFYFLILIFNYIHY